MRAVANLFVRPAKGLNVCKIRTLATAVSYESTGSPEEVLKLGSVPTAAMGSGDVSIKMLAAPLNTSDFNMIEGTYGIKAKLPAVGGNEGVGVVTKVGAGVTDLKVNDWVIPASPGFGTWRDEGVAPAKNFIKVPNDIPVPYAATIAVNPCTAYRLLRDFGSLKPGDVIMQNGANSMVGLAVIQMAREMGVKTVNIIRSDRPDAENTLRLLANYGGDVNVPDSYVGTPAFKEILSDIAPCKLAFNCVGGNSVLDMARSLPKGATIVTYGGMSKKAVELPGDILTSKALNLEGFWMSEWNNNATSEARTAMLADIATMIKSDKLSFLYEMHDFDDFDYAMKQSFEPFGLRKVVLNMNYGDRMKEHDALDDSEYEAFGAGYR